MLTWKIVGVSKVSVLYIYIYIDNNNFLIKKYIQLLKGLKSDLKLVTNLKIIRKSSENNTQNSKLEPKSQTANQHFITEEEVWINNCPQTRFTVTKNFVTGILDP